MNRIDFPKTLQSTDFTNGLKSGKPIGELHTALKRLRLDVRSSDLARKELGASTIEAIQAFQSSAGLAADGHISPKTVGALNAKLQHDFVAQSKTRTQRLHILLAQNGQALDAAEVAKRRFGPSTERALVQFQKNVGLAQDGRITEPVFNRLREDAIKTKLGSKTQAAKMQRTLLRALHIANLKEVRIDATELKDKKLGPSTKSAIKAIQTKYGLTANGQIDVATFDRLSSIAASIPDSVRKLKPKAAVELTPLRKVARLNMQSDHVGDTQLTLAFLGYQIDESEFSAKLFGKTTRNAVVRYQHTHGLATTGHADGDTLTSLNQEIRRANPESTADRYPYRIRGAVRDKFWQGMPGVTVQIWEKLVSGRGTLLAQRETGSSGFFDIPYDPPREPTTNQIKQPFHLEITVDEATMEIRSKLLFNPTQIAWSNFTQGTQPYRGVSEFAERMAAIAKVIGNMGLVDLSETVANRQITLAAQNANLNPDDVMRLILAHRASLSFNRPTLNPETCYGYIAQNLPSTLPSDLIDSTEDWTLIDNLVDLAANGLAFMDDGLAALAFDNAVTLNLFPIATGLRKDEILRALAQLKQTYVLEKPILIGNGSLKKLLDASIVDNAHYPAVASTFLKYGSFGPDFWTDAKARPADFGGVAAIADLKTTVDVGHIAKNFDPMVTALKQVIADVNNQSVRSARDLAKFSHDDWVALVNANGRQVPPNTDGQTAAERIQTYAMTLASQSEQLFPATALIATVARSGNNLLPNLQSVQTLLDSNPDFDLRKDNLDIYVKQQNINVNEATLTEARVLQRVHRIAPTAVAGQALLDNKIHNSAQIVAMGKDQFMTTVMKANLVDKRVAMTIYGHAEFQYAQVLQRIADFRFDLHRADPTAIIDHTYTTAELPAELAAIPNLETLFGSLDYCSCTHCQSVYGPAAYLADIVRFLDKHPSETPNKTAKDMLFERRPDIGNIKLNCENTETPLPYIDLVCEVLENAIAAPNVFPNFNFQTTRSAAELRAAPEHVRDAAYTKLRDADFPLNTSFDASQEQARVFLDHLGVSRWELMEAFQSPALLQPPDPSIAGEYWKLSSHETTIITAGADNTATKQKIYWGIAGAVLPTELTVADFMRRSFLSYEEVLELLYVRWLNPLNDPNNVTIERPNATCDTEQQKIVKLTADRMDKMHRFLRLWRHVGWKMWEIDLLIRAAPIGDGKVDDTCLARLWQFAKLKQRLNLSVEQTLVLFANINAEARVKPDSPQQKLPSLYDSLFLNLSVVNPVDTAFQLPIAANLFLTDSDPAIDHRRTLLAAFSLTAADLDRVQAKLPDNTLNLANISKIGRYAWLAKGLSLAIKDLLTLQTLSGTADLFASPKILLEFIESADWVTKSTFTVDELDYLLLLNPTSAMGLRDEVITQYIESLRAVIRSDNGNNATAVITDQSATTMNIAADQMTLLLQKSSINGQSFIQTLQDPALVAQDNAGAFITAVTLGNFANIYAVFRALHKSSLAVLHCKLDAKSLDWLLTNASKFKLLNPSLLPVNNAPASALFPAWLNFVKWKYFTDLYPEPEGSSLRRVFDMAGVQATPIADIKKEIVAVTQWQPQEVDELVDALGLQHGVDSDFGTIEYYLRMDECRRIARRIGVTVDKANSWAARDDNANNAQKLTAQEARQAAKSKYDDAAWLEKVTPLEDKLREKKRDALIGYLVANSVTTVNAEINQGGKTYANPLYWRDGNDLLKYFLIDVEMCSCQLTSRIKQAISSVQMFVQRCLLGLEQPRIEVSRVQQQDNVSDNSWKQWQWMKSYRIWEANRKVFLYPENWLEPELRDDKSPFFKELEGEISQADINNDNAAAALLHYVQKVHDVARLDIVGTYYELDDTDPRDNLPPDTNVLHVVGRTRAQPAIYYYRKFDLNYGEWSAWEKIDLDIQSDQVIPVIYNRRLYLFWLTFMEKPQKVKKTPAAKPTTGPSDSPEAPNQLELQLCWSAHTDSGWTTKRVSHQKLIHPWQRPLHSYNLKPRYKSRENILWLDVYISQSQEFNSTEFWDGYEDQKRFVTARHPVDETARPWHSSSFLFDGEVVDVKMKALTGQYHILESSGLPTTNLRVSDSLTYVHDNFGLAGKSINQLSGGYEIAPRLPLPGGMRYRFTKLVNNTRTNGSNVSVLENGYTRTLMSAAKSPFEVVASQHSIMFDTAAWGPVPFFYQDNARTFFIRPEWQQVLVGYNQTLQTYNYNFFPFTHTYTPLFIRELKRTGLDGLLNRQLQTSPQNYYPGNSYDFANYGPGTMSLPDKTAKKDGVDFERYGAYALYNWEIFFHAPLMIACRLSQNQRFAEAMRWFHYIFDPTNVESPDIPQRYWVTRPFFEQNADAYRQQRIDNLLKNIEQHQDELRAWKNNPFKPHLIARYRPVAYQKNVVMKYIDNLIAWADQLFRRDTIESINEATTLYVLAYELLGRRPVKVPNVDHADKSYNELTADGALDPFGNKKVDILMENFTGTPVRVTRTVTGTEALPMLDAFYFAIPNNDRLLAYWDTVEDRLFKIRHCMNIQGVVRQLPLFEPPIDPALLVKAAAAGVDLDSVLGGLATPTAPYRFRILAQKASEFCGEVRALGDRLLAALEKLDAEGLSLLRSTQEITLQQAMREIRKQQISEANENWASLEKSKSLAQQKKTYYEGRDFMNPWEITATSLSGASALIQGSLAVGYVLAGALAFIPKITGGVSGFGATPVVTVDPVDGKNFAEGAGHALSAINAIMSTLDKTGSMAATIGGYWRRKDEWDFQSQQATTEIAQIDKQIAAAQIRLAIAEKELMNQELQIESSLATDEYMRTKYTNRQLYDWQVKKVASSYFQCYQLAYDMAKCAEKCFQHERGEPTTTFIEFGYWDSLKKGLLAGDCLGNDIRRMEAAYLQQNHRDLEITKSVSLAQFLPLSLLALKESGTCSVVLPEWLFDMDYPGHYFRRIKSVAISIPCVAGPYTSVNCTLSLTNNGIRIRKDVAGGYGNPLVAADARFYKSSVLQTAIATSNGQNDSGLHELSFNEERFLPFEGAGAVSEWTLDLPRENNQFDLATVADVVMHIRYTARSGEDNNLTQAAKNNLAAELPPLGLRMLVINQEFGTEWHRFLHPAAGQDQTLTLALRIEHLPFYTRGKSNINLTNVQLITEGVNGQSYSVVLTPPGSPASVNALDPDPVYGGRQSMSKSGFSQQALTLGNWELKIQRTGAADFKSLPTDDLRNAYLVLGFKIS